MISKKIFKQHSLLEHPLLWRTNIDIDWSLECRTLHNICCPIPCYFARIALFAICFVDSAVDLLQSSRYIYKQAHIDPFFMAHCRPQFGSPIPVRAFGQRLCGGLPSSLILLIEKRNKPGG